MDMQRISHCACPMTSSALRPAQSTQNHSIESVNASKSMKNTTKHNSHGCALRCSVSYSIGKSSRNSIRTRSSFRRFECQDGSLFGPFGGQVRNSVPQPPPSFFSKSLNFHVHLSPGGRVDLRIHQAIAQFIFSTGAGGSIPHPPWRIVNVPIVDHVAQLEVRFPETVVVCIQHFLDLAGRHEMEFEDDQALSGARLVLTAA